MNRSIYIGFDPREKDAYTVAWRSILNHASDGAIPIIPLKLAELRRENLYWRPTSRKDGRLWGDISGAPMATEFAVSRFLTPIVAETGWALFMDSDMLVRADICELFDMADDRYAVMCVKHRQETGGAVKMDGQLQTFYARKNWSSAMLMNCDHPANKALTVQLVNTVPGRDLHAFCWLKDEDIGELPVEWNWLAGVSAPIAYPRIVHHTLGTPDMDGYENAPYADEWRSVLKEAKEMQVAA